MEVPVAVARRRTIAVWTIAVCLEESEEREDAGSDAIRELTLERAVVGRQYVQFPRPPTRGRRGHASIPGRRPEMALSCIKDMRADESVEVS